MENLKIIDIAGIIMDSPNPLDGGRVGNLLGLGASPASSTAATPVDKKVKRKKNLESQRTYRFDLTLKSCETNGKEVQTLSLLCQAWYNQQF